MTVRPHRPSIDVDLGEAFTRVRRLERLTVGAWVYVGSGLPLPDGPDADGSADAPPFLGDWVNIGGTRCPLRFRWLNDPGIEIQGSITGGATSDPIFQVPNSPLYRPDFDLFLTSSDSLGGFVPLTIQALTGFVYYGIV